MGRAEDHPAFTCWWYWSHRSVAYLGLWFNSWKSYVVMCFIRGCIGVFGFYSVALRKIQLTKVYYGLFAVSGFLAFLAILPVQWMDCKCTGWLQCKALRSFESEGRQVQNPFWEPRWESLERKRRVPYEEAPHNVEEAQPFTEELLAAASKQSKQKGISSRITSNLELSSQQSADGAQQPPGGQKGGGAAFRQDTTVVVDVDANAFGHRRLVRKRRAPAAAGLQPEALVEPEKRAPKRSLIQQLQAHAHADEPDTDEGLTTSGSGTPGRSSSVVKPSRHLQRSVAKKSLGALHFFNITPDSITWATDDEPACTTTTLDVAGKDDVVARLRNAHLDQDYAQVDTELTSRLYLCIVDPLCGAVSAEVVKEAGNETFRYRVCEVFMQLAPEPQPTVLAPGEELRIFFQRNPIAIKQDLESTNSDPNKYYKEVLRSVEPEEGMSILRRIHQDSCLCDDHSGGCRTYKDTLGEDRFWCWVRESSRQICIEEGVQLFWDSKHKKIWSEDICAQASCKCSYLGMLPEDSKAHAANSSLLRPNRLNYGSSCKTWDTHDTVPWCYAGYDTNCPDRNKPHKMWVSKEWNIHPVKMQYVSSLPCEREAQLETIEAAQEACDDISRVAEVVLLLVILACFPMIVILFKFLSNRCGDEFHAEAQFAVIITTEEEEESEEEWAAKSTNEPANEPPKDGDGAQPAAADGAQPAAAGGPA